MLCTGLPNYFYVPYLVNERSTIYDPPATVHKPIDRTYIPINISLQWSNPHNMWSRAKLRFIRFVIELKSWLQATHTLETMKNQTKSEHVF